MAATPSPRPQRPLHQPLAALASLLGLPHPPADPVITGATHDSAAVRPGDLFAALPGTHAHGAQFVADAVTRGAVAVLTDPAGAAAAGNLGVPVLVLDAPRSALGQVAAWAYGNPSRDMDVIAVTGTDGKTTTAHLLEAGLRAGGHTTGLIGTIDTRIAGEAIPSVRTTPEATDLQALLALMRERGVTAVAIEVSSHALALGRVASIAFAAGLFTNLSQDHLDFHGDMETYFAAKATLFDGRCRHEVVNVDDAYGRRLVKPATVTVSAAGDPSARWRATDIARTQAGASSYIVNGPDGLHLPAGVRSPGSFNVANGLLAVAALVTLGVSPADAVEGTASVDVPGRMERFTFGDFVAVVDYAHTPEALSATLSALRSATAGRLLVVLGAGGDRDRAKRPLMGEAAARGADLVIITDDNPRSEDPAEIRAAVSAGACRSGGARPLEIGDRRAAIAEAIRQAGPGDTVLIAGKGHEQGQEIEGVVHPFDDRKVLTSLRDEAAR